MKSTVIFGFLLANVAFLESKRIPKISAGKGACLNVTDVEVKRKLQCGGGKIISDIKVRSFVAPKCENSGGCSGLQVEVLKTRNLCYWTRSCVMTFWSKPPLVQTSDRSCIGISPSSVSITYTCVKQESITFFQSDLTESHSQKVVTSDSGILVSHVDYPWHYLDDLKLLVTLRPKTQNGTLYLWKRKYDIDVGDRLRARVEGGDFQDFGNVITGNSVELEFVTEKESPRGPGFIICYRWDRANKEITEDFVCGKRKKRGRKGRRKKGKGKKKTSNKNKRKNKKRGKKNRRKKE